LRTKGSREEIAAFRAESRAQSLERAIPDSGSGRILKVVGADEYMELSIH
jgi:hypothetical protein